MSSNIAVRAEGLAKRYRLGRREKYRTLRDTIADFVSRRNQPIREEWVDALRGVSFEVRAGEVVGIIGRNGAGKSTLLKVLARITEPTAGQAAIHGRMSSLLEVGTGFHPELTGRENIFLNAAILGMRRAEILMRFDEIVAFAEVERFVDTPVKHYSSGMYLRLAFAVAAHLDPEILVVDEVLAVGDASFQKKCLNKMQDVGRNGRTVLFVSHNLSAVESLCGRGILLVDGTIAIDGSVEDVIAEYASSNDSELGSSVAHRVDRKGDGSLRFESISVTRGGANQQSVQSGGDVMVTLTYRAQRPSRRLHIALSVFDQHDRILFTCDNEHTGDELEVLEAGSYQCLIPELPLTPGNYRINIWAAVGGNVADYVQRAAEFTVSPIDFFGTGKLPDSPKFGPFIVKYRWAIAQVK